MQWEEKKESYGLGEAITVVGTGWSEIVLPRGEIVASFSVDAIRDDPFVRR